ncbi:hypothetical protein GCM10023093_17570 [Nemorincola caseinilytica]|uniref:histidine kinase n=1 Tax=Nemorincola caseinilytica TaxID=2054315 RepID=A0ABP8NFD1_9BACT
MNVDISDIFQAVMDNVTDSVLIIGTDHTVICFNEHARTTLRGIHARDVQVGNDYRTFVSDANKAGYMASFEKAMKGEKAIGERELPVYDRKVWYRLQMCPIYEKSGAVAGAIITITDIDTRKAKEAALYASEALFERAFEHSSIGVALVAADGSWMRVNKTLCDIVGYTGEELLQLSPEAITHPQDRQNDREQLQRILDGETDNYSMEKRLLNKNGTDEWISGVMSAIKDHDGRLYYLWQLRHITERKRMIERLKASEDLLQLFVEHSPAAIAMVNMDMRYMMVSRRWMADYGLQGRNVLGMSHYEVFPTIGQEWKDIHRRCLAGAIEKREEDSFVREDGHTEWLRWEIHPWCKPTGEVGGIIMLTEVITVRKTMEAERERIVADLVSRNRALNEFAEIVSHNLRGPLATIMGLTNMLAENIAGVDKEVLLMGIGESAGRLDAVVRELSGILNAKTHPSEG